MDADDSVEVSEMIDAPRPRVWAVLTETKSWRAWWAGHKLKRVKPSWSKGGVLTWNQGRDAVLFDVDPESLIDFGGSHMGMEIHRIFRLSDEGPHTRIVYCFAVKGADIRQRGEEERKMQETLRRLKATVESGNSGKSWWQFWK